MPNEPVSPLKSAYRFLKYEFFYGTLLYHYGVARHKALLEGTTRSQSHTYTRFYRSPGQLEALTGPVMEHVLQKTPSSPLRVLIFAGSNGAESYTLASTLLTTFPDLEFEILASDLHDEMVERANEAVYSPEEIHYWATPPEFVEQTFNKSNGHYSVRPEVRSHVSFQQADLLDPNVLQQFAPADLVFMQNVLCHLDVEPATIAFWTAVKLMKHNSALFIDGMSLDLREELTTEADLVPLDFKVREIHEFARTHVGERWWNYYYGMEPYARWHRDSVRRFATIFVKDTAHTEATALDWDASSIVDTNAHVAQVLRNYLCQQNGVTALNGAKRLLDGDLLNSCGLAKLVNFIETEFQVAIADEDFEPRNFESLDAITSLVLRSSR